LSRVLRMINQPAMESNRWQLKSRRDRGNLRMTFVMGGKPPVFAWG